MEEIKKYRTEDGKVFDDIKQAEEHEKEMRNPNKDFDFTTVATIERVPIFKKDIKDIFIKMSCHNCPFGLECENMMNRLREHSTDTFGLCNAVTGKY